MKPVMIAEPRRILIAERVPCLHWTGSPARSGAAVLFLSGGGGRKEDVAPWIVDRVVAAGIDLFSIDLPFHGERVPPDWTPPARATLRDFLDLADEAIEDIRVTTKYIREDAGVGTGKVGLRAISLSASFALAAIGAGVTIDACLSICGSGDFAGAAAYRMQREGVEVAEMERELRESAERLQRVQPVGKGRAFDRCSVLMIHGVQDQSVPLQSHRALYDAIAPYYVDHPQDCIFLLHAGKHGIRPGIEKLGWAWLIDQLVGAEFTSR